MFRSKTPTADLYSTQEKEKVPNRPKTPLVDTRNMVLRSKTPVISEQMSPFNRNDFTRASMGGYQPPAQSAAANQQSNNYINTQLSDQFNQMKTEYSPGSTNYQYQPPLETNYMNGFDYTDYPYKQQQQQQMSPGKQNYGDYGYTTGVHRSKTGSLPRGGRKESTSFEHSEPLPGNLTRWPRPERRPTDMMEITVTLHRQDSGFGFRIVGGTEEGSQVILIFLIIFNYF